MTLVPNMYLVAWSPALTLAGGNVSIDCCLHANVALFLLVLQRS